MTIVNIMIIICVILLIMLAGVGFAAYLFHQQWRTAENEREALLESLHASAANYERYVLAIRPVLWYLAMRHRGYEAISEDGLTTSIQREGWSDYDTWLRTVTAMTRARVSEEE
jgi:hypothetical protein